MQTGISIYPGLDNTLEENLNLLEEASRLGVTRVFLSFSDSISDPFAAQTICTNVIQRAKQLHFEIILDVSPTFMQIFSMPSFSLSAVHFLGVHTVRLPDTYNAKQLASLSHNTQGIHIGLNASTITGKFLQELASEKADFTRMDAIHSAYPRKNTGLSESTLVRKTSMLHKAGLCVSAFVPSQSRKSSPQRDGMPTLEMHREVSLSIAARHLVAIGIDTIFVGDSLPSEQELSMLGTLIPNRVALSARLLIDSSDLQAQFLRQTFTARLDEARDAVRADKQAIKLSSLPSIPPIRPSRIRPYGAITIDNDTYGTSKGELQILKRPLPADPRVNTIAHILEEEQFLINYIIPGKKFSFLLQ